MDDISDDWSNQMWHVTDSNCQFFHWLHTNPWDVGLYGWVAIQLDQIYRVREIDLTNSKPANVAFVNWNAYTINDAFLSVGNSLQVY